MLQSLSSSTSSTSSLIKLFQKLDTNADNSVDRTEFIAGRPDDVSEDQAGSLFDSFDSSGSGSLGQSDLVSAFQQMSSAMQGVLLQAQESGQSGRGGGPGGPPDAEQMAEDLDSDGDGTVTRDEFVAGRPDDVSESDAGAFFDKIASAAGVEDTSSGLSTDQLASGLQAMGPPPGPPPSDSGETSETSDTTTEDQLLQQLLSLLQSSGASTGASRGPDASQMFEDLDSDGDGTVSRAEFTAGRPSDVSETQASDFYDQIVEASGADGDTGLSEDQLASGMQSMGPPPGPPPSDSTETADSSQSTTTTTTTTNQLLQQLLAAVAAYEKNGMLGGTASGLAA